MFLVPFLSVAQPHSIHAARQRHLHAAPGEVARQAVRQRDRAGDLSRAEAEVDPHEPPR